LEVSPQDNEESSLVLHLPCIVTEKNKLLNDILSNFYEMVSLATGLGYTSLNINDSRSPHQWIILPHIPLNSGFETKFGGDSSPSVIIKTKITCLLAVLIRLYITIN